jgi:hypothetical protein
MIFLLALLHVICLQDPVRVREVSVHRQEIPLTVPGVELSRDYGRSSILCEMYFAQCSGSVIFAFESRSAVLPLYNVNGKIFCTRNYTPAYNCHLPVPPPWQHPSA